MARTDHTDGPVLLTGANGMLGRAWRELCEHQGLTCVATDRDELDIRDPAAVDRALDDADARLLVNCAAYTDVDGAESDHDAANSLNGDAVGVLARACATHHAVFVHYSTDYVFSGSDSTPYRTANPRDPINAYGRSKAAGEQAIEAADPPHLLIRTSWLYAPWGKNFVRTIAHVAAERDELRVVNDQRGRPTEARTLAANTLALLRHGQRGVRHLTDDGECTWYEFAREIVKQLGLSTTITPCASDEFPRPAARPAYSVLDLTETEAAIGPLEHWTLPLERTIRDMETN